MVSSNFEQLKVLVVDDDPMLLNLIGRCLMINGAAPTLCENAYDGIREAENVRPDVILVDLVMPGRDGFAFLHDLRELGPGCGGDTPVVVITGAGDPEVEAAVREAGAGYLSKPFTPVALFNSIAQTLRESARLKGDSLGRRALSRTVAAS